jgi:nucleoside-diphosphate-sugar epimerase
VASLVDLRDNMYRRPHLYNVNVYGVAVLLNACIGAGVRSFVYVSSSSAVLDGRARPWPHNEAAYEDVRLEDVPTHYGRSKRYR